MDHVSQGNLSPCSQAKVCYVWLRRNSYPLWSKSCALCQHSGTKGGRKQASAGSSGRATEAEDLKGGTCIWWEVYVLEVARTEAPRPGKFHDNNDFSLRVYPGITTDLQASGACMLRDSLWLLFYVQMAGGRVGSGSKERSDEMSQEASVSSSGRRRRVQRMVEWGWWEEAGCWI